MNSFTAITSGANKGFEMLYLPCKLQEDEKREHRKGKSNKKSSEMSNSDRRRKKYFYQTWQREFGANSIAAASRKDKVFSLYFERGKRTLDVR